MEVSGVYKLGLIETCCVRPRNEAGRRAARAGPGGYNASVFQRLNAFSERL
jgi:hypothetical protein